MVNCTFSRERLVPESVVRTGPVVDVYVGMGVRKMSLAEIYLGGAARTHFVADIHLEAVARMSPVEDIYSCVGRMVGLDIHYDRQPV